MKKIVGGVVAALIVVAMAAGLLCLNGQEKKVYRVVCLGDSIVGNVRDDTSITSVLETVLGEQVFNGAFGGTTAANRNTENRAAMSYDALSLVSLVNAICYRDFGVQNASIMSWSPMEYFPEAMYAFDDVEWDAVEILVIEHGANDYMSGIPLDNAEDPYDVFTFGGALRTSLELLQEKRPELRIILCTPTYCWMLSNDQTCEEWNAGYGILEDYVNLELQIAREYRVEVLDNYHDSVVGQEGSPWSEYTIDGVHLNEFGRAIVAQHIADQIASEEAEK